MTTTINASTSSGLVASPDNSGTIALQSNGTTQLTVSATGTYGQLVSSTAQAATSGTAITFTGIPTWVKRITMMFYNISATTSDNLIVQIGSGSFVTSGYTGTSGCMYGGSSVSVGAVTNGVLVSNVNTSSDIGNGHIIWTNPTGNLWCASGVFANGNNRVNMYGGGVSLSGVLDRIRLTSNSGSETFTNGYVNILYEG
jgi:hypothetical protein